MSEAIFPQAIHRVLQWEGGYANDPDDPGGETNFGISRRSYPMRNIAALTREQAIEIYHRDFWIATGYDKLPDPVGAKMLDMAVNMGQRTAGRLLQRAINAVQQEVTLVPDGIVGPRTVAAAAAIDDVVLLQALRARAKLHYQTIAAEHPPLRKYLRGWLRRAAS